MGIGFTCNNSSSMKPPTRTDGRAQRQRTPKRLIKAQSSPDISGAAQTPKVPDYATTQQRFNQLRNSQWSPTYIPDALPPHQQPTFIPGMPPNSGYGVASLGDWAFIRPTSPGQIPADRSAFPLPMDLIDQAARLISSRLLGYSQPPSVCGEGAGFMPYMGAQKPDSGSTLRSGENPEAVLEHEPDLPLPVGQVNPTAVELKVTRPASPDTQMYVYFFYL